MRSVVFVGVHSCTRSGARLFTKAYVVAALLPKALFVLGVTDTSARWPLARFLRMHMALMALVFGQHANGDALRFIRATPLQPFS
jgi:hypothetical protein